MNLTKREIKLIIIALIIVGGGSLVNWGILPLWNRYQTLNREITEKQQEWEKTKQTLESGKRYKERLSEVKGELTAYRDLFFNQKKDRVKIEVLNTIDEHLRGSGLVVENKVIQVEEPREKELTRIICRLSLQGRMEEVTQFLIALEQSEKLFMVTELGINANPRESQLMIDLSVKTVNLG